VSPDSLDFPQCSDSQVVWDAHHGPRRDQGAI